MKGLFNFFAIAAFAACLVLGYYAWQLKGNLDNYEAENKGLKDQTENLEGEVKDLLTRLDDFKVPEEASKTEPKPKETTTKKPAPQKKPSTKKTASASKSKPVQQAPTPKEEEGGPVEYGIYQPNRPTGDQTIPKSAETTTTRLAQTQNAAAINFGGVVYHTYVVDVRQAALNFYFSNPVGNQLYSIENLRRYLNNRSETLLFAANGGMFDDFRQPLGLFVQNGKEIAPINLNQGVGNFYIQPNGVFYTTRFQTIGITTTNNYNRISSYVENATQSGPMLLTNGQINPNFQPGSTNRTLRSGVGQLDENRAVFVISNNPVNFYDFAAFLKEYFGCSNALYLDGGISEMYIPDLGRNQTVGEFGVLIGVTQVFN